VERSLEGGGLVKHGILVVDDHPIVRDGLRVLIDQQPDMVVCGEAGGIDDAMKVIAEQTPTAAVVDISLGRENGLELIGKIRALGSQMPVLALSMHDEMVFAERALRSGALGYVMKQEGTPQLLTALRQVMDRRSFVSPAVMERLLVHISSRQTAEPQRGLDRLTDRELEIFRLIGIGLTTNEIAAQLSISVKTVETHRTRIKEKMSVDTTAELIVLAAHWTRDGKLDKGS
jgi:DNA-binding NarL/FixJ family response regulator